jgi:SIR2-like domain
VAGSNVPGLLEHYRSVVRPLAEGRVAFFLGAGVNRDAGEEWEPDCGRLPLGRELAAYFSGLVGHAGSDGLALAAQELEEELGRFEVKLRTHEQLDIITEPKSAITFIAELPRRLQAAKEAGVKRINAPHPLIVTTNYDTVLEEALAQEGEPFDVVTYHRRADGDGEFVHHVAGEKDPREILRPNEYVDSHPADRTVILKLHGSIVPGDYEHAELVITEDDYIEFLANDDAAGILPVGIAARMKSSHLLFLGYGLNDWNLRVILRRMWGPRPFGFKSWAVQLEPSLRDIKQWKARGVEIWGLDLSEYIAGLDARLAEHLGEVTSGDPG